MARALFTPNAEITWQLPGEQLTSTVPGPTFGQPLFDDLTCEPIYGPPVEKKASVWLEMNVNATPLNAEVWDEDGSSEYLRVNLIGRFAGKSPRERLWPESLQPQDVVTLRYWMNQTHVFSVPAYVYPRGVTALRRPTRRLGDAIRVQCRVQNDSLYDVLSYFPKNAPGLS